jgi:hypothetical protein
MRDKTQQWTVAKNRAMADKKTTMDSRRTQNDDRQKTAMGNRKIQNDDRQKNNNGQSQDEER